MKKNINIVPMSLFMEQNVFAAIEAFADIVCKKDRSRSKDEAMKQISHVFMNNIGELNQFTAGANNEDNFTAVMIKRLSASMNVLFTTEEFDRAWNAKNPKFCAFKDQLKSLCDQNKLNDSSVIILGITNPKDMKYFLKELRDNSISYTDGNGIGRSSILVDGLPFYTTYTTNSMGERLLHIIVNDFKFNEDAIESPTTYCPYILRLEPVINYFAIPELNDQRPGDLLNPLYKSVNNISQDILSAANTLNLHVKDTNTLSRPPANQRIVRDCSRLISIVEPEVKKVRLRSLETRKENKSHQLAFFKKASELNEVPASAHKENDTTYPRWL